MDSVSLSKDKPYFFSYARKGKDALRIMIRQQVGDIQFQAPASILNTFQRLVTHFRDWNLSLDLRSPLPPRREQS
jgi:hypothetical protein